MKEQEFRKDCYFYHPDHLGSYFWITYTDGRAVQHLTLEQCARHSKGWLDFKRAGRIRPQLALHLRRCRSDILFRQPDRKTLLYFIQHVHSLYGERCLFQLST